MGSPPGHNKSNDPRRNKNLLKPSLNPPPSQEDENVYNPKKDLYSSRPPPHFTPPPPSTKESSPYGQEVYSPSQDVQDMYAGTKSRKNTNSERDNSNGGMYNPRQDLSTSHNHSNPPPPIGVTPLNPPWAPPSTQPLSYNPYDNFYGGNGPRLNQGYKNATEMGVYNEGQDGYAVGERDGGFGGSAAIAPAMG